MQELLSEVVIPTMSYISRIIVPMLEGTVVTLKLFFITIILSIPLGVLIALARISKYKLLSSAVATYIWLLRGTPLLLQVFFVYYGLPNFGIVLDNFPASCIAFVLNYAAYLAEIFRAGIQSIDKGQYEGAKVLGFTYWQTMWRVILPQTVRRVLPRSAMKPLPLLKTRPWYMPLGWENF